MLELLFLLLPIAAAYGWYMGRRSVQQDKQQEANRLSREYVDGVNFLLSNQREKAVDLFLDMLKEEGNTVEAHLTLGNLFRSRGEVDRAIRIHQSLMESASLTFEQKLLAIQQLGRDYMVAGLYDRAEDMFRQLVDEEDYRRTALQQLSTIYQATSEWQKAIEVSESLVKLGEAEKKSQIAHFYCELALQAMGVDDLQKAAGLLKKAASVDDTCARVSIMQGRLLMAQASFSAAAQVLEQVLEQDKDFVSEMLPLLKTCYQYLQAPEKWEAFVRLCVEQKCGAMAELYLADILEQKESLETAQIYINRQLQSHPTMQGFHRLMNYHLAEAEEGRAKESLVLLRNLVSEQIQTKPRYRCVKCGFTSNTLYWHCPSCKHWSSVKPIRGLDGQ